MASTAAIHLKHYFLFFPLQAHMACQSGDRKLLKGHIALIQTIFSLLSIHFFDVYMAYK